MQKRILITGAGGFIGSNLSQRLINDGHIVDGLDIQVSPYLKPDFNHFYHKDLRANATGLFLGMRYETQPWDEIYHLAADMGGIGEISTNHARIAMNNTTMTTNLMRALEHSKTLFAGKLLFSSSACVYPAYRQHDEKVVGLKELDAWPAEPEPGYGLEKLYAEELLRYYANDYGWQVRIVRFHNVFGPYGTYDGGREKAPAAVCRKIAKGKSGDTIEIWGDGEQTRSFMYIEDCVEGLIRLMASDYDQPLNLGREELVSINELYAQVASIAGKFFTYQHDTTKPQGVRGRNSDNTLLRHVLQWEPTTSLAIGLARTYEWINSQVNV